MGGLGRTVRMAAAAVMTWLAVGGGVDAAIPQVANVAGLLGGHSSSYVSHWDGQRISKQAMRAIW